MIVNDLEITNCTNQQRKPKVKRQYAAGFRNINSKSQKNQNQKPQNGNLQHFINMIGVNNMAQLYSQELKKQAKHLDNRVQKQKQRIDKLYHNLYPKRKQQQKDEDDQDISVGIKKLDIDEDQKYVDEQVQLFITKKIVMKICKKLREIRNGYIKSKEIKLKWQTLYLWFICCQQAQNLDKKQQTKHQEHQQGICIKFKQFLHSKTLHNCLKLYKKSVLKVSSIDQFKNKSIFLYCFMSALQKTVTQLPSKQCYQIKQIQKVFAIKNELIVQLVPKLIETKYTKPLNINYHIQKKQIKGNSNIGETQQQQQYKFQAKKIPATTYKQPIFEKIKKQSHIIPQPFNLSENKQPKITPEDYYHWQTIFKASQIPQTTYKPQKVILMSEEQKKAQALLLLKQAAYPKTMSYLQNINEFQKDRNQSWKEKHFKERKMIERNEIPNYLYLHAKQMEVAERIKEKNNKKTAIKPFKLSQNKNKNRNSYNNINQGIDNALKVTKTNYSNNKCPYQSKSTKKFDNYVQFRKKCESMQKQKRLAEQKLQKQREAKQRQLGSILKYRIKQELTSHPIQHPPYQPNKSHKINVNYQKIYRQKPLLMESTLPAKEFNLPWDPIFSHNDS